jgi:hypothetical protein
VYLCSLNWPAPLWCSFADVWPTMAAVTWGIGFAKKISCLHLCLGEIDTKINIHALSILDYPY